MSKRRQIAIFGVGAMGCLFGTSLNYEKKSNTKAEVDYSRFKVTLFGSWREQVAALKKDGLVVILPEGGLKHCLLDVTDSLAEMEPVDIALILVKSHQTKQAAERAAQVLKPSGIALTLQNGLGNKEILSDVLGENRVTAGITSQGATMVSPGFLRYAGGGMTYIARMKDRESLLKKITELLNNANIGTELVENVEEPVWEKLAVNASINPLTALLEVRNGELLKTEFIRRIMAVVTSEVVQVAAARKVILRYQDVFRQVMMACKATSGNKSSMLQDILRGAHTEIDAINGAIISIGKEAGIPTPVNVHLTNLVKAKESGKQISEDELQTILN